MSNAILEVKNLKKYFKTPNGMLHAVDDVSFTIEKGKTLGVVEWKIGLAWANTRGILNSPS